MPHFWTAALAFAVHVSLALINLPNLGFGFAVNGGLAAGWFAVLLGSLVERIVRTIDNPSQITPNQAGS